MHDPDVPLNDCIEIRKLCENYGHRKILKKYFLLIIFFLMHYFFITVHFVEKFVKL